MDFSINKKIFSAVISFLLLLIPNFNEANTISYGPKRYNATPSASPALVRFPQFNPGIGDLKDVDVFYDGMVVIFDVWVNNLSPEPQTEVIRGVVSNDLIGPGNLNAQIMLFPEGIAQVPDNQHHWVVKLNSLIGSQSATPANFNPYKGYYFVDLQIWPNVQSLYSTNGLIQIASGHRLSNSLGDVSLTYTYNPKPIPEPSTLLLLGYGLTVLAGYGWKKFFKK